MLMFICLLGAGAVTLMCGGIAEGRPLTRGNRERGYVMPLSPLSLTRRKSISASPDSWACIAALSFSRSILLPCFQRDNFSSYGAAIDAVVVLDCKIAVSWMWLDRGELHWLPAPRAGVVYKNGQRHGEFLSPPAN